MGNSRAHRWISCVHTLVLGVYPVLFLTSRNLPIETLPAIPVIRAFAVAALLTVAMLWAGRRIGGNLEGISHWLSVIFIAYAMQNVLLLLTATLRFSLGVSSRQFITLYACIVPILAMVMVAPWRRRARRSFALNAAAAAIAAINMAGIVGAMWSARFGAWHNVAETLTELPAEPTAHPFGRDIYYIVLDGFGRADILRKYYDLDLSEFATFLESRGFYIAREAHSNYAQTYPSLAATLNVRFIDPLADVVGEQSSDTRPLKYLIDHNSLMKLAHRAGYRTIAIGADNSTTNTIAIANDCRCQQFSPSDFEKAILDATPLSLLLPVDEWTAEAHRRKIHYAFDELANASAEPGPKFVFVHILAPHPPFVFGPAGERRLPNSRFVFNDGNNYLGTPRDYQNGYRDQAIFLTRQVVESIRHIQAHSKQPPAIVIQGDHGPASMMIWNDPGRSNLLERMSIFAAFLMPGDAPPPLYPSITPVNGARVLANRYFGTDLPSLADRSVFASNTMPYQRILVDFKSEVR